MSPADDILRRLSALRSALLRIELRSGILTFAAIAIAIPGIVLLAEMALHFNASVRTAAFIGVLLVIAATAIRLLVRPLLKRMGILPPPPDAALAVMVGSALPDVRDRLLNALELHQQRQSDTRYSGELIDAFLTECAQSLQGYDLENIADRRPVRRASRAAAVSAILLLLLFLTTPTGLADAAWRLANFREEFVRPPRFILQVEPGNTEITKGGQVDVSVSVASTDGSPVPDAPAVVFWKPDGQEQFESQPALRGDTSAFTATLPGLRTPTDYYVHFAGVESDRFRINVVDHPLLRQFRVRLTYPSYTGLAPVLQDEFLGDVTALAGTTIRLEGRSSKPLSRASLIPDKGEPRELRVSGDRFSGSFRLTRSGYYHVDLADTDGLSNENPVRYALTAIPDQPPTITILEPGRNIDVAGVSVLPLRIRITDDFGFSALRLAHRLVHSRYEQPRETPTVLEIPLRPSQGPVREDELVYSWDFSGLRLAPEDVVEYYAEVADNDAVAGPKWTRSRVFLLRLPSLEEVFTDLDRSHETAVDDIRRSAEEARELRERIESLREDFRKNKDMDWQEQKKLEETARNYEELQRKLDDVRDRLEAMTEDMSRKDVLSPETMEKYLELQQLFSELNSSELQEALKRLQQAMQGVSKEQMLRALQEVSFSEERFRQSIDRTLDLLKRIQIEQKMDELRKRTEEVLSQQQDVGKELDEALAGSDSTRSPGELAGKQQDVRKQLDQLRSAGEDLQNRMEEFFTEMPEEELAGALQRLDSTEVGSLMDRAAGHLRQMEQAQARALQQTATDALEQFSDELSAIQAQMLEDQQQFVINELRRATRDLLELSTREEHLKTQAERAPSQSPLLRENAQEQVRIVQDLQRVTGALQELSKRSFAVTPGMAQMLGETFRRMQNSLKALDTRNALGASQEQRLAMESLNKAAMEVRQSLQMMMQQGGGQGGGLLQQLRTMAGQQMSLNARTQTGEDAARLAVEQQALQKSLEQLNAEARSAGDRERILGDLQRIAEEMKEVARDLEQNNVNPETIRRQERILSRLLDASRSTREQDFERKRRSKSGRQMARPAPPEPDAETLEGRSRLREDLLRALEHGYSRDYQDLIRRYFEELQKAEGGGSPSDP